MADPTTRSDATTSSGATLTYADAQRRYRLDSRIAAGGMGEVWRATDTLLDRPVAVKMLLQQHADDAVFRSRFVTEAQHAAGLQHPGIAQVFDFGAGDAGDAGSSQDDGAGHAPYIVMELVDGRPLSQLVRPGEPMDPEAATALLVQLADARGAAHANGVVHRDVKPANILVTDDHRVKITDFGIARAADAVGLTRTGEVLGTPAYLSPEQAEGKPATPASDVYALGAVAYECVAGRRAFDAETPVATALAHLRDPLPPLPGSVPPALAAVVTTAMAKAPEQRYADGSAFAAALREAVRATPPPVATPSETLVMTAPVAALAPASVTPTENAVAATTADVWRERARRVPIPVWAVAGVFLVLLLVAAFAGATAGGGADPTTTTSRHTPSTHGASGSAPTTPGRSPSTATTTASPPVKAPPGGEHGKGKGHKKHGKGD